ncbi:TRAP transporter large permease subunit [Salinibacterium sp. ZJ454]|uniref:TRAP transporter large permease n=1 Tax=Salinibacterium sp. ZJ454 TaxID=2708339 RepID=UPI00141D870E|nr:TRAP transporter large permease subunit [Salinibacterium sp. ZJ454]
MSISTSEQVSPTPEVVGISNQQPRGNRRYSVALLVAATVTIFMLGYLLMVPTDPLIVGLLVILLVIALMLFKIPVAISLLAPAVLGLLVLSGPTALWSSLGALSFHSFASWSLSVIPMFILMGVALGKSGLMSAAYDTARKWLGWLPGGLAVSANFASAGMAAASGSSVGIAYAVGRVSIPEMLRAGYRPSMAIGTVAAAGTLGQVIPPSVMLVIYAGIAETPIGPQLLAGIIPGIILAILFSVVIVIWAIVGKSAPPGKHYSLKERLASLANLLPILVIVLLVLGGIYLGIFTATEAGAYGAAAALLLGVGALVRRSRKATARGDDARIVPVVRKFFSDSFLEMVSSAAAIFLLLVGVNLLTRVMALSGVAQWTADVVVDAGFNQLGFLLMLIPVYLILGFFLSTLEMLLLTIPVFIGPLVALDVDLIWFGVFLIILAEIDMIAPPLGLLNFVVYGLARSSVKGLGYRFTMVDVFKGVLPFIAVCLLVLVLLVLIPELATWLPSTASLR